MNNMTEKQTPTTEDQFERRKRIASRRLIEGASAAAAGAVLLAGCAAPEQAPPPTIEEIAAQPAEFDDIVGSPFAAEDSSSLHQAAMDEAARHEIYQENTELNDKTILESAKEHGLHQPDEQFVLTEHSNRLYVQPVPEGYVDPASITAVTELPTPKIDD